MFSIFLKNSIEAPLGGVPPPPLVLADLLQELLFWPVSDKFPSSSWQPCCAAPWTAVVIALAHSILSCKRRHVSCAPATTQEEAYWANVCLGRIFGTYPIDMPISQALDWDSWLARTSLESLFRKCMFGKPIW